MPADLVGRAEELAELVRLCGTAAHAPGPAVALVTGRPGEGKTRLLDELCGRVPAPHRVRIGGYEPESGIPLASARELLRLLAAGTEGALVDRLLFRPSTAAGDTLQLFEAAVRAMAARPSLHVVVDDLQWVDEASTALLLYAVRAAESTGFPLVLLAAGRPTPTADRLGEALRGALADEARLLRLDLAPLRDDEGAALARLVAPGLDGPGAAQVARRAGGSPFWIEVLALEHGGSAAGSALDRRLRSAAGDAGTLLAVLAVAGRPLDRDAPAGLLGWPQARVERAVAELVVLGLLTDDGAALSVAHAIVRDRALAALGAEAVRGHHRRLARWLEQQGPECLLDAVEHGRRGGLPMVGAARRLADSPRRRLLGAVGLALLRAVAAEADPGTPDGVALERATARLAGELGDHEVALELWAAAARRTPAAAAEALLAASESALHLGRPAEAERLLAEVARRFGNGGATGVEADARAAAVHLWLHHQPQAGQAAARRAVRRARQLAAGCGGADRLPPAERQGYLRALLAGAEAAILADRPADVLVLADELAGAAGAADPRLRIRALVEGGIALRWLGRGADAEARLRLAWAEARAEVLPQAVLEVGASLAKVLHSRGRLAEAGRVLADCDKLGQRLAELGPARAITPVVAALVEASVGDWRCSVAALRAVAAEETDPHYRAHAFLEGALVEARLDPVHARHASEDVERALADAADSGCRRCGFEVSARGAEVLARIGDDDRARVLLEGWAPDPGTGNRALLFWGVQARAALLGAQARADAADAWAAAVAEADRCGMVLEGVWARLDLAAALAATDRARAAETWRAAGRTAESIGARTEVQVAEQGLRKLGVRTWRRSPAAAPPGLTARETEIARRVAAGASNGEIAAALFLSRKTVERHVSNILARTGLRNRAELAAAWSGDPGPRPEGVPR